MFIFKKCNVSTKRAINDLLTHKKYVLICIDPEEGRRTEHVKNFDNEELFQLYRNLRKKYLKIRNDYKR